MNHIKLKSLIEEQETNKFLKEEFYKSVKALDEQHVLCEGLVKKGLITEEEIDEAFFDTVKNLGKNAIDAVKGAWQKAKQQGDKDEMARIEKKLATLKAKNPTASKKAKTASKNKKISPNAKAKVGKAIVDKAIQDISKNDPKLAKTLKKTDPDKLAKALKSPKVQDEKNKIVKQLQQEPENPKAPGLVGKIWSWSKKNPVKVIGGLALIAIAAYVGGTAILNHVGAEHVADAAASSGDATHALSATPEQPAAQNASNVTRDIISNADMSKAAPDANKILDVLQNPQNGAKYGLDRWKDDNTNHMFDPVGNPSAKWNAAVNIGLDYKIGGHSLHAILDASLPNSANVNGLLRKFQQMAVENPGEASKLLSAHIAKGLKVIDSAK